MATDDDEDHDPTIPKLAYDDAMFRQRTPEEILENLVVGMRAHGVPENIIADTLEALRYGK